ncbi:MAG: response regulator [Candidatus Acidiferrales bacterium]
MPTILVADDNSNIQKMVSLAFEEHGIDVVAVGNGEAAVRRMPDLNPDLVLADVFMPVRNGYEVCEFVKKDPRFSKVPVILLVGAFDPLDENEARRVGADGVLKKPFVPPDPLIAMVTSALEKIPRLAPVPEAAPPLAEVLVAKPMPPPTPFVVPESEPEPDESVYAYGTGRRTSDEEQQELPAPVKAESEEEEEPEREPESRWSETGQDWRRNTAMGFEVPENTAQDSAAVASETTVPELTEDRAAPGMFEHPAKPEEAAFSAPPAPVSEEIPEVAKSKASVSAQGSRSGTIEWMDMMAPPPPAEHPISWTPQPESETAHAPASGAPFKSEDAAAEISVAHEAEEPFFAKSHVPPEPGIVPQTESQAEVLARQETPLAEAPAAEDSFFESAGAAPEVSSAEPEFSPVGADSFFTPDEDFRHKSGAAPAFSAPRDEIVLEEKVEEAPSPEIVEASSESIAVEQAPEPYFATQETSLLAAPVSGDSAQSSDAHPIAAPPEPPVSVQVQEEAASVDSSNLNVESLVARVLEKLEPHLHEILSNGVLRPLVESVLQTELKKKQ